MTKFNASERFMLLNKRFTRRVQAEAVAKILGTDYGVTVETNKRGMWFRVVQAFEFHNIINEPAHVFSGANTSPTKLHELIDEWQKSSAAAHSIWLEKLILASKPYRVFYAQGVYAYYRNVGAMPRHWYERHGYKCGAYNVRANAWAKFI